MSKRLVTLLTTTSFVVLSVTGVIAFIGPFDLQVIGLHALMGFAFVGLVIFHVAGSAKAMARHLRSRQLWLSLAVVSLLSALLWWQPAPVRALLRLSGNMGPSLDRFETGEQGMVYQYAPDPSYQLTLDVRAGSSYDPENPPQMAIWLENQSNYHIKTLLEPKGEGVEKSLPYWASKVQGWKEAREEAERQNTSLNDLVDAITSPTDNSSFDPADYLLPSKGKDGDSLPYHLLIEINQAQDPSAKSEDQPSLIYQVSIDNSRPKTFQLLDLVGYPSLDDDGQDKAEWSIYYVDERFDSALDLIDSALLMIQRGKAE